MAYKGRKNHEIMQYSLFWHVIWINTDKQDNYKNLTIMKRFVTILAALTMLMTGCQKDPVARFGYTPLQPMAGEEVFFDNLSVDADYFEWDFGDGTVSNAYNPVHTFNAGGTYEVTLKAFEENGSFDVAFASVEVISVQPLADFYITTEIPGADDVETDVVYVGEEITFNNISQDAASVEWNFGDGVTSTTMNPRYSYDTPGTYTITLTAFGPGTEMDQYSKTIDVYQGINSTVRITVKEYYEEYPVEGASVILFGSLDDWENEINPSEERFTSPLGKVVFQGLNEQYYYVDVWEEFHDNYNLASDDVGFIKTQFLEAGYVHDFIAYVDVYDSKKTLRLESLGKKKLAREAVSAKKAAEHRELKNNRFSKPK